jgi:ATP-dependent Clp protease ATP-binding subunit ClpB
VLFDEIEKASDALWNLLLGILDKATLTLGDNRRVDFSRAMIFMTSNLGAAEMGFILRPRLGFAASDRERRTALGVADEALYAKITRAGIDAARRKLTPEFMNRIDKVVVFRSLGIGELSRILSIELNRLQQRILNSAGTPPFVVNVTPAAREFLLREGADMRYGARLLKRAIERALVHPLSNLIASNQVHGGDLLQVDFDPDPGHLIFIKAAEDVPVYAMMKMIYSPPASFPAATAPTSGERRTWRAADAKIQRIR